MFSVSSRHNFEAFVLWRVFDVVSWIETWIYRDPNWCVTFKSFFSEFVFDRMNKRASHRQAQNITFCVIHRNRKCVCLVHSPLNSICFLIMSSLLDTYFRATSCHVCLFTFRCLSRPILLEANWLGWRAENGKRQNKSPWIESKRDVLSVSCFAQFLILIRRHEACSVSGENRHRNNKSPDKITKTTSTPTLINRPRKSVESWKSLLLEAFIKCFKCASSACVLSMQFAMLLKLTVCISFLVQKLFHVLPNKLSHRSIERSLQASIYFPSHSRLELTSIVHYRRAIEHTTRFCPIKSESLQCFAKRSLKCRDSSPFSCVRIRAVEANTKNRLLMVVWLKK